MPIDIAAELRAISAHPGGVIGRMRDLEEINGFSPIKYGSNLSPKRDWRDGVISLDLARREVRIVAIFANDRRKGALTRLLRRIYRSGYSPVKPSNRVDRVRRIPNHEGEV